jgi:hypothetical protein
MTIVVFEFIISSEVNVIHEYAFFLLDVLPDIAKIKALGYEIADDDHLSDIDL